MGLKSTEDITKFMDKAMAGDPETMQVADLIKRRANDAIVDYERLTPLEREITSRLIFFYPWLKGASRYTFRFALEHPMQAAGLMMLGEHAFHTQQQMLGPTPFYESTDVPISTKSLGLGIPGVGEVGLDQFVGDHTWTTTRNGEEMPMVFDVRQGLTQTTPTELTRAAVAYFTGDKNAPRLIENLTPFFYAAITSLQGYDSFRHKEVPQGIKTFIKQMQDVPQVQKYHEIFMSDEDRRKAQENQINPRSKGEAIAYATVSGFAPAPYSRSVAAERLESDKPSRVRHIDTFKTDFKKYTGGDAPQKLLDMISDRDDLKRSLKRGMKSHEKLDLVAPIYGKYSSLGHRAVDLANRAKTEGQAEELYGEMHNYLTHVVWAQLSEYELYFKHRKKAEANAERVQR
jgi:hypothetical protein